MADYSYAGYGAAGPTDGGGFVANGDSSSQNPNAARREYGKDTLRPITIKQALQAEHPDADPVLDGAPLGQVTLVGRIRNVTTQSTHHMYNLDDGTGAIDVKQWIDPEVLGGGMDVDEEEGGKKKDLVEGVYARVYGNLGQYGKRNVIARNMRVVTDHNEVQCHLLEAAVVHLSLTRGPPGQAQKAVNGGGAMQGVEMSDGMGLDGAGQAGGGRNLPAGLSPAARRVYHCLNTSNQTNEGLHMQDIATRLGMDMGEVAKGGDELLNNGLVYTTVDDQTWAILDDI